MQFSSDSVFKLSCLAAALVLQREEEARKLIVELRRSGVEREAVREAILQTYLFDGYPTALEGMALLADVWQGNPEPVEKGDFAEWETWERRGWQLYRRVYGEVADQLQDRAQLLSPELARWMIVEGYGKVLSRGILDAAERELIIIAVLAVKRRPNQLHSHLRGALRVGATKKDIVQLFNFIQNRLAPENLDEAIALFQKISTTEDTENTEK